MRDTLKCFEQHRIKIHQIATFWKDTLFPLQRCTLSERLKKGLTWLRGQPLSADCTQPTSSQSVWKSPWLVVDWPSQVAWWVCSVWFSVTFKSSVMVVWGWKRSAWREWKIHGFETLWSCFSVFHNCNSLFVFFYFIFFISLLFLHPLQVMELLEDVKWLVLTQPTLAISGIQPQSGFSISKFH